MDWVGSIDSAKNSSDDRKTPVAKPTVAGIDTLSLSICGALKVVDSKNLAVTTNMKTEIAPEIPGIYAKRKAGYQGVI